MGAVNPTFSSPSDFNIAIIKVFGGLTPLSIPLSSVGLGRGSLEGVIIHWFSNVLDKSTLSDRLLPDARRVRDVLEKFAETLASLIPLAALVSSFRSAILLVQN